MYVCVCTRAKPVYTYMCMCWWRCMYVCIGGGPTVHTSEQVYTCMYVCAHTCEACVYVCVHTRESHTSQTHTRAKHARFARVMIFGFNTYYSLRSCVCCPCVYTLVSLVCVCIDLVIRMHRNWQLQVRSIPRKPMCIFPTSSTLWEYAFCRFVFHVV